jgi:hypothetical protein
MRRYPRASAQTRRCHPPWQNLGRHVPVGCVAVGRKHTPLLQSSFATQEEPSARGAPHTPFKQVPVAPHITSSVQTLPAETTGMQALSSPRQYCPAGQVVAWQGRTPQIWPLQYPLSQKFHGQRGRLTVRPNLHSTGLARETPIWYFSGYDSRIGFSQHSSVGTGGSDHPIPGRFAQQDRRGRREVRA